jgi:hypothetical protein
MLHGRTASVVSRRRGDPVPVGTNRHSVTSAEAMPAGARAGFLRGLTHRQLDAYLDTGPRFFQLGLDVLVTVALYYES